MRDSELKGGALRRVFAVTLAVATISVALLVGCSSSASSSSAASSSGDQSAAASSATASSATASSASSSATAETATASAASQQSGEAQVTLLIESPAADDSLTYSADMPLQQGQTVLEVLQATGLDVQITDTPYGILVDSIEGLANEGMKGWTYTVDGTQVQMTADKCELEDGNQVIWSYIDMSS